MRSFDEYPFSAPAIRHLHEIKLDPRVTFFVGENGTGKSTLLEAMALRLGFNTEGGTKNMRFDTRRPDRDEYDDNDDPVQKLRRCLTVAKTGHPGDGFFLRAESFHNVATYIDHVGAAHNYGGQSLHEMSHGESFFRLLDNRLTGDGIYIFDEPEAALSPQRQFAMLGIMHRLVKEHSQFIIATHSPLLLAYPFATIYELSASGIEQVKFEDTDHYRFSRDVLNAPQRYVERLLREDGDLPSGA